LALGKTVVVAISVFVLASALLVFLFPAFPMVTVPAGCPYDANCVGSASLSCVMFGVGGVDWDSHYIVSAGTGCHLTIDQAGLSSVATNTTVTSNLGDD
jgi:hypothetical protein